MAFLLKMTVSPESTSKRPPLDGISFNVPMEYGKRFRISPVKLRARGV